MVGLLDAVQDEIAQGKPAVQLQNFWQMKGQTFLLQQQQSGPQMREQFEKTIEVGSSNPSQPPPPGVEYCLCV